MEIHFKITGKTGKDQIPYILKGVDDEGLKMLLVRGTAQDKQTKFSCSQARFALHVPEQYRNTG